MATKIVIPEVGESITSGVIAAWTVEDGQYVERDQTVLELETDKITMEVPAPASGILKQMASEGDEVQVGAVVGEIDESATKPKDKPDSADADARGGHDTNGQQAKDQPEPAVASTAQDAQQRSQQAHQAHQGGQDQNRPALAAAAGSSVGGASPSAAATAASHRAPTRRAGDPVLATPVAEKIAQQHGISLGEVVGTGAGGRIREQDVLAYIQARSNGASRAEHATDTADAGSPTRTIHRERMSPLRQRVAARLVEAQHTAAMLTTFNEVDMSAVMALRKRYKEDFEKKHGVGLGFMSFFVKAAVQGLRRFPLVNGFITQDQSGKPVIQTHDYCDVAIAVASPKGLVVPVLRNAEAMSFAQIEQGIKDLATRAREGKLTIEEMTGGTFTITNGGVFGSLMSTPILNPPQSAILGMHAIKNRPVEDPDNPGSIVLRPMMYLAVSYDHRIIDGAEAVQFLVTIKNCIEHPERMLMDV
ncbi:MAG: dihydrolipoyllysine-residue succinyltransferase component of 2-oxoglutarate dehydrogenase complex [Phycisphaerales bacterium]|nr:MAG: dihydrolipoyllysine-residue succinyltransferase component of 2-oxoglutarate dehydrogenase complex [Phycisphaerales bacterium]